MRARGLFVLVPILGLALSADVVAQPTSQLPGPLACFVTVERMVGIDDPSAERLCMGATGPAPATCFARAFSLGGFTMYQAEQLCTGATSEDPVECSRQLGSQGMTAGDTVSFCAALHWPLVIPPNGGSGECVAHARDIGLADAQARDVCRGSTSVESAECVRLARGLTGLADADIVDLCTPLVPMPVVR